MLTVVDPLRDASAASIAPSARRPGGASIALRGVEKSFQKGVTALAPVDLFIAAGEFVSIVGPSGCGKSTLLRVIADLVPASRGECARARDAKAAFVFQEAALLPWRNVEGNAELLMELESHPSTERKRQAAEALRLVGLDGFETLYPHQLSGGMRMRLSLARAIALKPDPLLLDEPLAAVDELTRDVLQDELLRLWALIGFTAILVTHNVHEAVYLSKRVVVMSPRPGRVLKIFDIPLPDARTPELRASPEFARLAGDISATLRHGVAA